jgi:raffinose/stachyose/melibiose transport system substrate-binding protein
MRGVRFLAALCFLFMLILTACGGTSPTTAPTAPQAPAASEAAQPSAPPQAPAASAGERTKITYWYNPPDQGTSCMVDNIITPFNSQSTTVEVDAVSTPTAWDATRTAMAGGAGPDVVETPGPSFVFELAKAGQLLPLDEYVDQYKWSQTVLPWALNLGKVDGKLYSLPDQVETLVLYYNKTLFAEKGWQPPKTIDDLVTLADTIKEAGLIPFGHANSEWRATNEWFVGEFLNHVAGPQKVYDALTGKISWEDPDFLRAIEILNDMQQKGQFNGGLDRYFTGTFDEIHTALGDGQAAMNIEGTWFLSDINQFFGGDSGNKNEWDWVPVPSSSGDAIFDLGIGSTFSINTNSKVPGAAAEFLNYYFSADVQATMLAACGKAPAPVALNPDTLKSIDPRHAQIVDSLNKAATANNYGYTTWTFWPPKSDTYIYEEIEKVWSGELTPKQYLEGLQKIFSEELKAGSIPPIPTR